jgi:hypothetical protein
MPKQFLSGISRNKVKRLIESILESEDLISITVVNNLTTQEAEQALSAYQGYILKGLVDTNIGDIATNASAILTKLAISDVIDDVIHEDGDKALSANQGFILKGLIDGLTTSVGTNTSNISTNTSAIAAKIAIADIVNDLISTDTDKPLSAAQGKILKDVQDGKAGLASPAFTGTPTAPTAANETDTTQIATTAFVNNEIQVKSPILFANGAYYNASFGSTRLSCLYFASYEQLYAGKTSAGGDLITLTNTSANGLTIEANDYCVVIATLFMGYDIEGDVAFTIAAYPTYTSTAVSAITNNIIRSRTTIPAGKFNTHTCCLFLANGQELRPQGELSSSHTIGGTDYQSRFSFIAFPWRIS